MRKRLITPIPQAGTHRDEGWLDLDRAASVEVTSEEKEYPMEAALVVLELVIVPDISRGAARASLMRLRLS
jgi:hypothetical protein